MKSILEIVDAAQVIAWALALIALILLAWKGWPAIRRATEAAHRSVRLVDTLTTLPEDLEFIKGELRENGGGSVKDLVIANTAAVTELRGDVAHVKRQAAALKTSIAKTNRTIKEHIGGQDEPGR